MEGSALVAYSFQISLFPGRQMFPCSSQRDRSYKSLSWLLPHQFNLFSHIFPHASSL